MSVVSKKGGNTPGAFTSRAIHAVNIFSVKLLPLPASDFVEQHRFPRHFTLTGCAN